MDDDPGIELEAEIVKFIRSATGMEYTSLDSWAIVVRAHVNNGEGDVECGGLFVPSGTPRFTVEGLRWLFDEGVKQRYEGD